MKFKNLFVVLMMGIFSIGLCNGCGVKGDPMPPDVPAELGRGRPTFKKAVRDVNPVELPPSQKEDDDENKR